MELRSFLLGRGEFKTAKEIVEIVRGSARDASEDFENAEALLIFQTSTQQTWVVATNLALYCVLDDLNKSTTRVQWTIPATEFRKAGEHFANISAHDKNNRVGLLQIGNHKNWLFSKKLFADENVVDRLSSMVHRTIGADESHPLADGTTLTAS